MRSRPCALSFSMRPSSIDRYLALVASCASPSGLMATRARSKLSRTGSSSLSNFAFASACALTVWLKYRALKFSKSSSSRSRFCAHSSRTASISEAASSVSVCKVCSSFSSTLIFCFKKAGLLSRSSSTGAFGAAFFGASLAFASEASAAGSSFSNSASTSTPFSSPAASSLSAIAQIWLPRACWTTPATSGITGAIPMVAERPSRHLLDG
mmetsp:Transcript_41739/g.91649  ORF Transcript_41739/g.91649 Transcript_41739/m.91649 type:complete len:211 (-) Transcript_41739:126-758(-)